MKANQGKNKLESVKSSDFVAQVDGGNMETDEALHSASLHLVEMPAFIVEIEAAERCADPMDASTALEMMDKNVRIAAQRELANRPESHPDFDKINCVVCNEEIPAKRLAMHRVRCTTCQSEIEHRNLQRFG